MLATVCAVFAALFVAAPGASARAPSIAWKACGDPELRVQCATTSAPRDYRNPGGRTLQLALARVPATDREHRIGSLFYNFGGPGAPAVDYLRAVGGTGFLEALNERFDIVAMDPRGVGASKPSIDCKVNQEELGIYSQPFATPFNMSTESLVRKIRRYIRTCLDRNPGIFKWISTADVARDMDLIRSRLGERRLNYLGFSYGTFLGATYAALFPTHYRALVLDGPLDAEQYINNPMQNLAEQTAGFERALGRFFQACAANQTACSGFGGEDPWGTYDMLVDRLERSPIPATGYAPDPRPVDGDDINAAALATLYAKQLWGLLGAALAQAEAGDGSLIRLLVDEFFYGRDPETGEFDPISDRYFTLSASEQRYPHDIATFVEAGNESWGMNEHFSLNNGLVEINWGLWPIKAVNAYYGPFRVPSSSPTPLVVATRYDPATPYRGALRLVREMRNARLLTMWGDGHTAYGGNSTCIDESVNAYFFSLTLPAPGTICRQEVPFEAPSAMRAKVAKAARADAAKLEVRLHTKPLAR